jgi:hypothetical protein
MESRELEIEIKVWQGEGYRHLIEVTETFQRLMIQKDRKKWFGKSNQTNMDCFHAHCFTPKIYVTYL